MKELSDSDKWQAEELRHVALTYEPTYKWLESVHACLKRKVERGKYLSSFAPDAFLGLVRECAKVYNGWFDASGRERFSAKAKKEACRLLAYDFELDNDLIK